MAEGDSFSSDRVKEEVEEFNERIESGDIEVQGLEPEPAWSWLLLDYKKTEMPPIWFGGGTIYRLAVPYWLQFALFAWWPALVWWRRGRRNQTHASPSV